MSSNFTFGFGKYKGSLVSDIVEKDAQYCEYILNSSPELEEKNNELYSFLIKHNIPYDKDYNKKIKQKQEHKSKYFTFGKYKDEEIADIYRKNKGYCEYIITMENVNKYHRQTVQAINNLIIADQM